LTAARAKAAHNISNLSKFWTGKRAEEANSENCKAYAKNRPKASWATVRVAAKLEPDVTPHTLRHTRATWLMQAGIDLWEAAGSLGMSLRVLETVYRKHSPDYQANAAEV
jgi:integrase